MPVRQLSGLPVEATSFIDRRRDVVEVKRLLGHARLVTLTGTPGVGKTRLGLRAASELAHAFPDGVWLVDLSGLQEPELVPDTVMMTFGIHDRQGWSPINTLLDHLRGRHLLLVLDNCEHLVDACAALAHDVLSAGGQVRMLATSRWPLGVAGEHIRPVTPLAVPDPGRPLPARSSPRRAALTLLEERAAAVAPGLSPTPRERMAMAGICRRLDGIPLAIELAAVQLRGLSPRQVLDRLDDRFGLLTGHDRQELLRATLDWSFSLCTPAERSLWSRLSVFAGSFDLAAAEDVCGGNGIEHADVLHVLAGLADKSVVLPEQLDGDTRLRLLQTVREYGLDRLRAGGDETALRIRHRDHYLRLAESTEAGWFGPDQVRRCELVRRDHADLRAALEFSRATPGQARTGLRLAASLWFYWIAGGLLPEGRHWLEQLLQVEPDPSRERVDALWAAGYIAVLQGDVTVGSVFHELSRILADRLGDDSAAARATSGLGLAAMLRDDNRRAVDLENQALARLRRPGSDQSAGITVLAMVFQAAALVYQGEIAQGIHVCEEARSLADHSGEQWTMSWVQYVLARAALASGEPSDALAHACQSLRIHQAFHDPLGVATNLELLAWITVATGDRGERAPVLLGAAHHAWTGFGVPGFGSRNNFDRPHRECENAVRDAIGDRAFDNAFRRGTRLSFEQAVEYALAE